MAAGAVALAGPLLPGGVGLCPSQTLVHLDCPACGATRGVHALARGDVVGALDHNLLLAVALPAMALLWLGWVRVAFGRPPARPASPAWLLPAVVVVLALFTIARNLAVPELAWLDSR
jgi:hypothetical protein